MDYTTITLMLEQRVVALPEVASLQSHHFWTLAPGLFVGTLHLLLQVSPSPTDMGPMHDGSDPFTFPPSPPHCVVLMCGTTAWGDQ